MADYISKQTNATANIPTNNMAMEVDKMIMMTSSQRKIFERKWYDNTFFDDGYHFRYISRQTGKIIDLTERGSVNMPERAIPKASRQIRGVVNLMKAADPVPVIYPENITSVNYPDPTQYQQALQQAKQQALRIGQWIENEWKRQDLDDKLTHMILLAAKHSISYLQIWKDFNDEKIRTKVRDAFEIYLLGNLTELNDSPFLITTSAEMISSIKANPMFDPDQRLKITPDNKYASSEIKQAYMMSRFGTGITSDYGATLILKEAFIKEYLTDENFEQVSQSLGSAIADKKMGDMVMRHVFSAGGVWLRDEYINLKHYPFVDLRLEPGPLYQTALIERFIPANKSLDIVMSRIEKFINTMVTGMWLKRKGENFEINNIPGGQVGEYTTTPPAQMQMTSPPPIVGEYIQMLEKLIEEQGASTSALGVLPEGVKSGVAIESVKSTEYANLKIPTDQMKKSVKKISEKMIEIASEFVKPQTVYQLNNKNEPDYFNIIGQKGMDVRQQNNMSIPDAVPIKEDYRVDIEIESGLGFTIEGKKQSMQQIITYMMQLTQAGLLTVDAVKVITTRFLEIFQFGSTQEFMEAMDSGTTTAPLNEDQLTQMKVAIIESMKDAGMVGPEHDQKLVDSTKVGVTEALKDTGVMDSLQKQAAPQTQQPPKIPTESIGFKDLPPEGQVQMAAQAGIQLTPESILQHKVDNQIITNSVKGPLNAQTGNDTINSKS